MSVTTMWAHGNSLVVEDPGEYAYIRHRGWGTELSYAGPRDDEDGENLSLRYCHIPIPTPESVDGVAARLVRVLVLYETSELMEVSRIDVWDGNSPVAQFDESYNPDVPEGNFRGRGNHLTLDPTNQLTLPGSPYTVSSGLGISLAVAISWLPPDEPESIPNQSWILTVTGAGAEFIYPAPIVGQPKAETARVLQSVKRHG